MAFRSYLVSEIAADRADGLLSRREALHRLALLGLGVPAASAVLAACGDDGADDAEDVATTATSSSAMTTSTTVPEGLITFPGESGEVQGAYAAAAGDVKGAIVVVHENRGLTPHIRSVADRLAADGYAALAPDLVSPEGGTAAVGEAGATAALGAAPEERLVGDVKAAIIELGSRLAGVPRALIGFCFGGGMTWSVLAATTPELAAAVPFYGPFPADADLSGNSAAVLGVYAELDTRVNATRDAATAALSAAGLTHEIRTSPAWTTRSSTTPRPATTQTRQPRRIPPCSTGSAVTWSSVPSRTSGRTLCWRSSSTASSTPWRRGRNSDRRYVAPMPVFALWSAPRARSTAFFRSVVERGDLVALHEPFCNLADFGETDVEGRRFDSPASLLAWLRDQTHDISVFLKDTTDRRHHEVLADRRFLAEARHAFLVRRPEEIAASFYALKPDMRVDHIGLAALHELHAAVRDAGGHRPVVLDSDDLVTRPEATIAAYCAAVGLPFIPQALTWGPGERPEWRRSSRWHADVNASSGFEQRERTYTHTVESSDELARFAAHQLPFYEKLHAQRLNVAAWEPMAGS